MNAFGPDEGLDGRHDDTEMDEQFQGVREARKKSLKIQITLFWALMLAILSLIISGWLLLQSWQEKDTAVQQVVAEQAEKKEIAQEAQEALCGTGDREIYDREICERLAEAAEQPAPPADEVTQTEIVQAFREYCEAGNCRGANGRTPTAEEVAAAFSRFCADGKCRGPAGEDAPPPVDGVDGQDGQNATPEMVLAAVTEYCSDGRCVGAAGANGEPGPPPSAEAIQAAVNAFCANGACVGAPGTNGTNGTDGAPGTPGRGIVSMVCQQEPDYSWIVTYTDGTSEPIAGPCRVEPQPAPPELIPGIPGLEP